MMKYEGQFLLTIFFLVYTADGNIYLCTILFSLKNKEILLEIVDECEGF